MVTLIINTAIKIGVVIFIGGMVLSAIITIGGNKNV